MLLAYLFAAAPGSNANSVVEYVLAGICAVGQHLQKLLAGGIIGYGHLGRLLEQRLHALGIRASVHEPWLDDSILPRGVPLVNVLSSNVVSVHAELTDRQPWPSRHLIGASQLQEMNEDTLLVNASRGAVVDIEALLSVLESGRGPDTILDVWEGTTGTAQAFDQLHKDYRVRRELAGSSMAAGELDVEPCELLSALGCDLRELNT